MPELKKFTSLSATGRFRQIAFAVIATAALLGGAVTVAAPARADAPQYATLLVCTDVPGINTIITDGINQNGDEAQNHWQLDLSWDPGPSITSGDPQVAWQCAWTQTDVTWWWATRIRPGADRGTYVQYNLPGLTPGGVGGNTDIIFPFQGTYGSYDNSATYYACFITQLGQDSC